MGRAILGSSIRADGELHGGLISFETLSTPVLSLPSYGEKESIFWGGETGYCFYELVVIWLGALDRDGMQKPNPTTILGI